MSKSKVFRLIRRYTYSHEMAHGFPSFSSADAFNRKYFLKDEVFGPECWVQEYKGEVLRNEDGELLVKPVEAY